MTQTEQKAIDSIYNLLSQIKKENEVFRDTVSGDVKKLAVQVEQKHLPLNLEAQVIQSVDAAVAKALNEALTGYNSPLTKYAHNVVAKYQTQIESVFDKVVNEGIGTPEFKERVREVLLHKIAKTMVSGIDGSVDKTINLMKQDATFRAKLTLSVNGLVEEFLKKP